MPNGFFTDTTLCIGCKACEVACKQWNQLPADGYKLSGMSYDNTVSLSATTWRHVAFIEKPQLPVVQNSTPAVDKWLMMSDVCKHCTRAGCLEACPTGAIIRNEFGAVYVQPDICNGCGYCVPSCPFGVIALQPEDGRAFKCTLCYDRQKDGLEPACAKACPTDSIVFGDVEELKAKARQRVEVLHAQGETEAYLYGVDEKTEVGDLNAFFLLTAEPAAYGLPKNPKLPQNQVLKSYIANAVTAAVMVAATVFALRRKK
jgi:formate dehydrogenase iron-sulfur subunit